MVLVPMQAAVVIREASCQKLVRAAIITGVVNLKQFYLVTLTLSLVLRQTEGHLERTKITVTTDNEHEEFVEIQRNIARE